MTATLIDRLVARAMTLATNAFDDDAPMAELRALACGDDQALERAIRICLAQPASLATRHRAIELLARVRYEDAPTTRLIPAQAAGTFAVGQNRSAGERRRWASRARASAAEAP
jgi:hypothetical protein